MSMLQLDDIQGIILHPYEKLDRARFLLLGINDPPRTKAWLGMLEVRSAEADPRDDEHCINVAFTHAGIRKLGLDGEVLALFSGEFVEGMAGTEHRQRILGDVDESAPALWQWGGPDNPAPDLLLMLYAKDEARVATLAGQLQAQFVGAGVELILSLEEGRRLPGNKEHFGFRDGIAQPGVEGFHTGKSPGNTVAAGEFVLGYPNAYGQYTDRPLLPPERDPSGVLASAPDQPGRRDFGMNGTYLVFRQLSQDVAGFWSYLDRSTRDARGAEDPAARVKLASKMVGRWPSGAPLVNAPDADDPVLQDDDAFLYVGSGDRDGFKCPIGSHIRRSNPRDSLEPEPGSERSIEVGKRHRIIRRGIPYGNPAAASMHVDELAAAPASDEPRGLHFLCFNTHIGRQFEFIQHTWANNPKFDGLYADDDPLIGDRGGICGKPGGVFTVQAEPVRSRVVGMPRFVQVKGGAYFFMPGIRALRFLTTL